jgi:hypothetical protein
MLKTTFKGAKGKFVEETNSVFQFGQKLVVNANYDFSRRGADGATAA